MDRINKVFQGSLLLIALMLSAGAAGAVNVKDFVVLKNQFHSGGSAACNTASFKDQAFFRVFPDGSESQQPFEIPEGRFLRIVDVEWNSMDTKLVPNWTMNMRIALSPIGPSVLHVFQSAWVTIGSEKARTGTTEYLTAGFMVAPRAMICPQANMLTNNGVVTVDIENLILRGYIVDGP